MSPKVKDVATRIRPIGRIYSSVNSSKYAKGATEAILTDLETLGFLDVKAKSDGSGDLILSARHADPEIQKAFSDAILPEMMYRYDLQYGQVLVLPYSWSSVPHRKHYHKTSRVRYLADEFGKAHGRIAKPRHERSDEKVVWETPDVESEQARRKIAQETARRDNWRSEVRENLERAARYLGYALEYRARFREDFHEEFPVTQGKAFSRPGDVQKTVSVVLKDGEFIVAVLHGGD